MRLKTYPDAQYVVAWSEDISKGWYVSGFMDPLMALQTIEEAQHDHGFIWVADDKLKLVRAVRAVGITWCELAPDHNALSSL